MSESTTIDDLVKLYVETDDPGNLIDLKELARCARCNLDNIKPLAEANALFGIAWAQAYALCLRVEAREEHDE